ncbi:MAG: hypothetical protein QGF24_10395 [Dehalococcoidia bacterium]|jgi:hypothetical protein|nr:hypothetical protein [Dehalococcoidia bacterium]
MKRQRILYPNAVSRSFRAPIVGFAIHEPVESESPQIQVSAEVPYESDHALRVGTWNNIAGSAAMPLRSEAHLGGPWPESGGATTASRRRRDMP